MPVALALAFLLLLISATAANAGQARETSQLRIRTCLCSPFKKKVRGFVETGKDVSGARYRLTFEGNPKEIQPLCNVLKYMKRSGDLVRLRVTHEKQLANSDRYSGHLEGLVVAPGPN